MSTLAYGTVQLSDILTHSISHEPQWSADGVDYLWTKIVVSVQAVLNTHLAPASPVGTETPAQTMARIRHLLLIPRQQLTFTVGADTLLNSPSVGETDVNQGPVPQSVSITQIGGTETFLIDYSVETYVVECPEETSPPNYLSHRWRETATIDESGYTTRTRTGKITCRADLLNNADQLRGVVAVPIPNGFKRIKSDYTLDETGLNLQYTFQDKEVFLQPPGPAFKASGTYIESTSNGAVRFGECQVRLEGSKKTSKGDLLRMAITVALTKIQAGGVAQDKLGRFIVGGAIQEELYENIVQVRFRIQLAPLTGRVAGVPTDLRSFGQAPYGSDPNSGTNPPDAGIRGTALLALARAALRDPCSLGSTLSTGGGSTLTAGLLPSDPNTVTTDPQATVSIVPVLPDDQNALYNANALTAGGALGSVYNEYVIDSRYDYDYHTFQLPVASAALNVTTAFVQVAATTARRRIDWSCERVGAIPDLPSPNLTDNNHVLLSVTIIPGHAELMGDGVTLKFKFSGTYIYGLKTPFPTKLGLGLPPWINQNVKDQLCVGDQNFVSGIIDTCLNGGGSTILNPQ
jgi:hypothetical protein